MTARGRRWFRRLVVLAILILGFAWFAGRGRRTNRPARANEVPNNSPALSVVVARAHKGDLPIYLNGLGSVVGSNTVTVRTRVDGELLRLDVHEGQLVHAG